MEFSFPYKTKVMEHCFGAECLQVEQLNDLDETIDAYFLEYEKTGREELFEELCPYFGVPWPSGLALAHWVAANLADLKGKKIVEIGCGLAIPSLVLGAAGENVLCVDMHPDVPVFLEKNTMRNGLSGLSFFLAKWPSLEGTFDRILASDVLYEKSHPQELLFMLERCLHPQGEAILVDPNRPYQNQFVQLAKSRSFLCRVREEAGVTFLCLKKVG